ncbi:MAG: tetratricopeptide repeat protein [Breznakibacter sp.]
MSHGSTALSQADSLLKEARLFKGYLPDSSYALGEKALGIYRQHHHLQGTGKAMLLLGQLESIKGNKSDAEAYFDRSARLAQDASDTGLFGQAVIEQGKMLYDWGRYDSSLVFFSRAHDMAIEIGNIELECQTQYHFGKYCHTTAQYERAKAYYENALVLAKKTGRTDLEADILLSYSKYFLYRGNTQKALEICSRAYDMVQSEPDLLVQADACNHLGGIYLVFGQTDLAFDYHQKALALRRQMGNADGLAKSYNNIGEIYLSLGQYPRALEQFGQSLAICTRINYTKGTVKALNNISEVYSASKNPGEAITLLRNSLQLAQKSGYGTGQAETLCLLGKLYMANGKWDEAIVHFAQSNLFTDSLKLVDLRIKNLNGLHQCYLAMHDSAKALTYLQHASSLERVRMKNDFNRQLAETHILFETERREREYTILKRDYEANQKIIGRNRALLGLAMVAMVLLLLVALLVFARLRAKRRAHRLQIGLNRELESAIGEKDKLMSIIAHELRNPLYWFQNLTETLSTKFRSMPPQKLEKSLQSLDESAKNAFHLMDNLLFWSRSRLNRIKPAFAMHSFLGLTEDAVASFSSIIQQKQLGITVVCDGNEMVRVDKDLMMSVVRNLLSNAIKFTPEGGKIAVHAVRSNGVLTCRVDDSGVGIPRELESVLFTDVSRISSEGLMQEKGAGFGLRLCKEFVEMHGGTITVGTSTLGGGCIEFSLPVSTMD